MDILILMTAAICHDLDHPGYNNTYVHDLSFFPFKGLSGYQSDLSSLLRRPEAGWSCGPKPQQPPAPPAPAS